MAKIVHALYSIFIARLSIATRLSHRGHSCSHGPGRSHLLAVVKGIIR